MFKLFGLNPVFAYVTLIKNDLLRGCSHISSAGRHSAVTMPSCDICSIEAPSDKHLRMHIQSKHDARVLTCEYCIVTCKGGMKLKTHMDSHRKITCKLCEMWFFSSVHFLCLLKAPKSVHASLQTLHMNSSMNTQTVAQED